MPVDPASELIHAAQVLDKIGCLPATDGNFSARLEHGKALVTRKGIEKRTLTAKDLIEIQIDEAEPVQVSSEWQLHRAMYVARADVHAVLHVHAPYLGVFVAAGKAPNVKLLMEAELTLGGFAVIPYAEPGTVKLGDDAVKHGGNAGVLILERHGVVAVGASISEALHRLERAEFLARVELGQKLL